MKAPFLVLIFFLIYINDLPDDVICNIAIYADHTTLYSKTDKASGLWQQLEVTSEIEYHLQDIVDRGCKWLNNFNAGKAQLVLFDWCNNSGAIDMRMDGSPMGPLNWIVAFTLSPLLKLPPRKLESWFIL